jgi:phage FluMu protein Com
MSFQTQCPHCGKVLKLKSEAAVGRKAPCPKCKTPFVVEPYEEPPADEWDDAGDEYGYDYSDDDYGDYGDDYEEADYEEVEPAPSRSSRKSSSKGSKKKKKAAGAPAWLAPAGIGLAVLLGLALLGGGVAFLINNLGGSANNAIDLAWLPADADMYLQAKPAEMWNAPILAPLRDNPAVKNAMNQAVQSGQLNLMPEDMEMVTVAGVDMFDMMSARVPLFGGKATSTGNVVKQADPKQISVTRLKRDLSQEELAALPSAEKKSHGNHEYFVAGAGLQRMAYYLADPRTLISGTESELTKAIDRGPSQEHVSRIDFINPDHQVVLVFAKQNPLQTEASTSGGISPAERLGSSINQGAKAMAMGISLSSGIDLQIQFDCFDGASATNIQTEFESVMADAKLKLTQSAVMIPEQMQGLITVATQALDSVNASASGNEVTIIGNVPAALSDEIKKLSEGPTSEMFGPGMVPGGSGFGAPGFGGPPPGGAFPPDPQQPATSLNEPPTGFVPGGPDAATQADIEALQKEKAGVLDTTNDIRNRIKSGTGSILDSVPGSR